jgi:hypothetical protein
VPATWIDLVLTFKDEILETNGDLVCETTMITLITTASKTRSLEVTLEEWDVASNTKSLPVPHCDMEYDNHGVHVKV